MSYLITEAWLSSFPMIPISLVYSFSGMNGSFMNGGIGGQYIPQYNISADIGQCYSVYCSIFCAQFTPIVSQGFFCSDIDHNDHYYHDPYSDMPRLSLVDKARVIGQLQAGYTKKWMLEFVSGVYQEGERFAWPACSPGLNPHWTVMGPAGESCSYQSHHRHHAGSPSDCGR